MEKTNMMNDQIYGFIPLKPHIIAIIDTVEFQRLRFIWQLGVTPFVYPTADHSRFQHSIGTYYVASRLVTKLKNQLEDEGEKDIISLKDVMCVEIAALCHDIGHGPFSHVWDNVILPDICGSEFLPHEEQFAEIWKIMRKNEKIEKMLHLNGFNEDDEEFINALINGKSVKDKEIMCDIVSNSESGMDVDKWDYIARDSTYLGQASTNYRADIERLIHHARAIKDDNGKWKIAFRDTESLNVIRVFQLRNYMHQTACRHRTVVAIEQMMVDGFKRCISDGIISKSEIIKAQWILENNDSIFWSNVHRILEFRRILERKLYRPIFEAVKYSIIEDPKEIIFEYLKKHKDITIDDIRIGFCNFTLGNYNTNPILNIPFYKKDEYELIKFSENDLPLNLCVNCDESRVIVFLTQSIDGQESNINKMKDILNEYFKDNSWIIQAII